MQIMPSTYLKSELKSMESIVWFILLQTIPFDIDDILLWGSPVQKKAQNIVNTTTSDKI